MNAPMNPGMNPGMVSPPNQAGPQPDMGPGMGYPGGVEIMQAQQGQPQQGEVENPVLAGFRSIIMLIGALQDKGDPRAEPAKQALQGLLGALSGGDLPMSPPLPAQPAGAPPGAPQGPMPGGAPAPTPPPAPQGPAPAPAPAAPAGPELVSEFDGGQPPAPPSRPMPMGRQQKPMGKQPVVLT